MLYKDTSEAKGIELGTVPLGIEPDRINEDSVHRPTSLWSPMAMVIRLLPDILGLLVMLKDLAN